MKRFTPLLFTLAFFFMSFSLHANTNIPCPLDLQWGMPKAQVDMVLQKQGLKLDNAHEFYVQANYGGYLWDFVQITYNERGELQGIDFIEVKSHIRGGSIDTEKKTITTWKTDTKDLLDALTSEYGSSITIDQIEGFDEYLWKERKVSMKFISGKIDTQVGAIQYIISLSYAHK